MNVVSLFDGISTGQIALHRAGITNYTYWASEIDKDAIAVTQHHYPKTIQLGDVQRVTSTQLPSHVHLLIAGPPCQGLSVAGKRKGFEDDRSKLFFEFVRILKEVKPTYFLMENVSSMNNENRRIVSETLGVQPIMLDSASVSAQSRKRLYWTNIPFDHIPIQKPNTTVVLADILNDETTSQAPRSPVRVVAQHLYGKNKQAGAVYATHGKSGTVCTTVPPIVQDASERGWRFLTINECEALQTLPAAYTHIPTITTKRCKLHLIGNAWTADLIAHIFRSIPT